MPSAFTLLLGMALLGGGHRTVQQRTACTAMLAFVPHAREAEDSS